MRILVTNKFWYRRGGLERVMFDEISWLESEGHEVAHFSTAHPSNVDSPWSEYFVPYLELGQNASLSTGDKAKAALRLFNNREAARRFAGILKEFQPDLIHAHGIHRQISPSILGVARKRNIPVVQSLHDYHHVCPADVLLRGGTEVCEPRECGKLWFGPCIGRRCVRGSLSASALSAAETTWAHVCRSYPRGVKRFISPSAFLGEQMRLGGWKVPVDVIPNAVAAQEICSTEGRGFIYIGRLAREKGIEVALDAARLSGTELVVAGDGPLRGWLEQVYPEVRFTGHLNGQEVQKLISSARAVIVPSRWYENAPMSVLEPMATGVPVVASRIGGIPEQVNDGLNGLLVEPGNVEELAQAMKRLDGEPGLAKQLGAEAARTVSEKFSPAAHVAALQRTYGSCLKQ